MSTIRGLSLPLRIDPETGGWAMASDDTKIRENLVSILLTALGERPMRRGFGAGVRELVHDPNDAVLHALLQHQIAAAIAAEEPRVQLRDVVVGPDPERADGGGVLITLDYTVRGTRSPARMAVPLSLGAL